MNDNDRNETSTPSEDQLAALIRLAEGKSALPAHRHERVKTAVHAHWRQQVREHRNRRTLRAGAWLAAAALLVAAVGLTVWNAGNPVAGRVAAVVTRSSAQSPAR